MAKSDHVDVAKSWQYLENILSWPSARGTKFREWKPVGLSPELRNAVQFLCRPGMSAMLEEWLYEVTFRHLKDTVKKKFWKFFRFEEDNSSDSIDSDITDDDQENLYNAFKYLYDVYEKQYLEAVRRLKWLQLLAASAPSTSQQASFIFTPVRGWPYVATAKSVRFRLTSPTSANVGAGSVKPPGGRGEDGAAQDDGMEVGDDSVHGEGAGSRPDAAHSASMDGSYIPDQNIGEHSLLSESSVSSPAQPDASPDAVSKGDNDLLNQLGVGGEEDDDDEDESFIRSPIGGNKKLMSGRPTSGAPFPQPGLRAMSSTSTPGLALVAATPGQITPIRAGEATPVFAADATDDTKMETPSLQDETGLSPETGALPDASQVFGVPISARPVPGQVTNWPTKPANLVNKIQVMIKAVLFYTFRSEFSEIVEEFYSSAFHCYKTEQNQSVDDEGQQEFDTFNSKLDEMGLMEMICGSAVTDIVHREIEKHIDAECKGNFDTSFVKDLEAWLDEHVLGWLKHIFAGKQTASQLASVIAFRDRLRHFIYEKYGRSLIAQFFDIIIDFPDSKPAIEDLSVCLDKTDLRSELVTSLKGALESRLLHPGVNTAVILTAYIAAIKSLRLLEPAGVILELVCEPVGRYLRSREDTVRCIVASLTDDGNNELVSELVNTKPTEEPDEEDGSMNPRWEEWMPDPVDADPSSGSKFRRSADILSTLVNIYGSKELFVNEYRALLADRILMQYNYDVERELRYLELLKLRFGEAQLHFCEVMLRDVAESRRVNTRIQEAAGKAGKEEGGSEQQQRSSSGEQAQDGGKELELNAMILSAQFWPAFRDEKIKLPAELQDHLDKYTRSFEQQKQNRTLVWKPHLGVMNIDLELKGETLSFSVSPVQAAIIMKFQEKDQWSLDSLSRELEMTPTVLRRKMAFWQGQGLVTEVATPDSPGGDKQPWYALVEERSGPRGGNHDLLGLVDIEEEAESAMASAQQQKEEELQILWTYIQGMLANLDSLPLERIHAMLRMFATDEPGQELSLPELKSFLDNKVKDQILIFSSGVYRLNK